MLKDFFESGKRRKYYILLYVLLIAIFFASSLQEMSITKLEVVMFLIVAILGILLICYYDINQKDLHKVALVIILIFGIICVFLTPVCDICDESEHFIRSELVSEGNIVPEFVQIPLTGEFGYKTISSANEMHLEKNNNFIVSGLTDSKINYTESYFNSAFSQNPFYGYVAQAIGIDLAKFLDLNAIWMLWLGRLANLLLYAAICTIAIKKAPVFKLGLLITSCLPLAIYQGASVSIDALINALCILSIGYFLYMWKSSEKSLRWREIGVFYMGIILAGIIKSPYLFLSLLIFIVPNSSFKDKKQRIISKLCVIGVFIIGIVWTVGYALPQLDNSWRKDTYLMNNVSATGQLLYMKNNPGKFTVTFLQCIPHFPKFFARIFEFSNGPGIYSSKLLGYLYLILIAVISLIYPLKEKVKNLDRIKSLIVVILIFTSTLMIQYLTWASVGSGDIYSGVLPRYFIPLLVFIPFIINLNSTKFNINRDMLNMVIMTLTISFISGMIMLTTVVRF